MSFADLPTLAEVEALRRGRPISKGKSRLQETADAKPVADAHEKAFRARVIARDGYICRKCGRKVVQTLARVPERLEVHHIHGRRGMLAYEDRASLILCCKCHEQVTGRVNERFNIEATKRFKLRPHRVDIWYTDARKPVVFRQVC